MTEPTPQTTPTRDEAVVWPDRLTLRDTKVVADEGQRIFTTATGYGYEKREYVRADLASAPAPASGRVDAGRVTLFSALEAAYIRGAAWCAEMGMTHTFGELRKAAYDYADKEEKDVICRDASAPAIASGGVGAETKGPYEARICKGIPADCCDYGVVSLSEGREVCRVWREQDARAIAAALPPAETPVSEAEPDWMEAQQVRKRREVEIMQEYAWGNLTPLGVANHLRRAGFNIDYAVKVSNALAKPASSPAGGRRVRHKKRGGIYEVLGEAQVQTSRPLADYEVVVIYRSLNTPDIDDPASPMKGDTWVRPKAEFNDGRFEELSQSTSAGRVGE